MGKNPVTVFLRTRPTASFAQDQIIIDHESNSVRIVQRGDSERQHMDNKRDSWNFHYNQILHNAGQETAYNAAASSVVTSAINGVNGTVMAYGQTGAGKTFTMIGDTANFKQRGITARAIGQVFEEIAERPQHDFVVSVSYMELYNEKIFDLLDSNTNSNKDYTVVEDPNTKSMHVRGLTQLKVENEEEALGLLFRGDTYRTTAEHQLNKNSNRSHAIFTIFIEQRSRVRTENVLRSKLHLVDLAGSERLKKTLEAPGAQGKVDSILKKESMYINKSLTYLEQVVIALTSKSRTQHVPYRQTKLTNILKDSLGGNCSTSFIACIWGESTHLEETVSTLKLAQRMMRVENEAVTNVQTNPEIMVKRYEREIFELKQELMMHDALANRSGISYDEFTPEESLQVMNMVKSYIAASPEEEDDVLKLDSMRQIRECFKQFKTLFQTMEVNKSGLMTFSTGTSSDKLLTMEHSGSQGDSSASPLADGNLNKDPLAESKSQDNSVGEVDSSAGFGLGNAPANSRPPKNVVDEFVARTPAGTRRTGDEAVPPSNAQEDENNLQGENDHVEDTSGKADEQSSQNRNRAFNEFIQGIGQNAHSQYVRACRKAEQDADQLRETRAAIKDTQWRMEGVQQSLADKRMEQKYNDDGGSNQVVDEEEFALLKELKSHKKAFRQYHSEYNSIKNDFNSSKELKRKQEVELLQAFELWYSTAMEADAPRTSDEDILDDGECFDKLEIERVMAEDPESVAFFKAQKAQRERARKQPHGSPKARARRR